MKPGPAGDNAGVMTRALLRIAIPVLACMAYLRNRMVRAIIEVGAIVGDLFERFRPTPT